MKGALNTSNPSIKRILSEVKKLVRNRKPETKLLLY